MKARFLVIIERGDRNYSAYAPDVPGCVATGESVEATLDRFKIALEFHLEGMAENGEAIPESRSLTFYLENTNEISSDDILAHIDVGLPQPSFA